MINPLILTFIAGALIGWISATRYHSKGSFKEDFKTWKPKEK